MDNEPRAHAIRDVERRLRLLLATNGHKQFEVSYIPYSSPERFVITISRDGRASQSRGTYDELVAEIEKRSGAS
jgi:hypothetical protein